MRQEITMGSSMCRGKTFPISRVSKTFRMPGVWIALTIVNHPGCAQFWAEGFPLLSKQSINLTSCGSFIVVLQCDNNQLTSLDLSKSQAYSLWKVYCQNNQLTELRLPASERMTYFTTIWCYNNRSHPLI